MSRVSRPLSILHVSQPTEGGVGRYVADLAVEQVGRGWRVVVASPTYGELAAQTTDAGAGHVPWSAGRAPGPGSLLDATRLSKIVREAEPDLVHLHSSKAGFAGRLALRGRRPTIFQPHAWSFDAVRGPVRPAAIAWERSAARWAAIVLCVSPSERQHGVEAGIHANWRVVPNGVDVSSWPEISDDERSATRKRLGLADLPTVVCVGRLTRQKGQDVLLAAWPAVRDQVPQAQLVLVGDGPDVEALRKQADGAVVFAGHRTNVAEWLAAADVAAFPSRWEGMSIGLLEAMASGRSIVATDVPGASEALGEVGGPLVPPEDPAALAAAIVTRLQDPERAASEGRAARERVEQTFPLAATRAGVAELYEELLSSNREPSPL
jgi:glycosyltransferase involved in cell wall biosynthesis